jgi:DNA-binding response OmpR family regulator
VVDVYIGYLRRKLRSVAITGQGPRGNGGYESPIITVRSIGYRFNADA